MSTRDKKQIDSLYNQISQEDLQESLGNKKHYILTSGKQNSKEKKGILIEVWK